MPLIHLPPLTRSLTGNVTEINVTAQTIRDVIIALESQYPGVRGRLCVGDDLRPGLAVAVDGEVCSLGMEQPIEETSDVHFLPSIGGG